MKRFLFVVLLSVWLSPGSMFAQCGQSVDDQANIFGSKAPQVQAAVDKLVSDTGADVHVFTVSSMGASPTFEQYVHHVIDTCPSWQGPKGGVKNNLIVVAVALRERKTAFVFGSEWKPVLDSQHQRIQLANINPRFKSGDFAGGFVAGLNEIDRIAVAFLHPNAPGQSAPLPIASPDTRPVSTTNVDFSGLGTFLFWLLFIGAGAALLYLFYRWFVKFGEQRGASRSAQHRAVLAKEKVVSRVVTAEMEVGEVGAKIIALEREVSASDLSFTKRLFRQAETAFSNAMDTYGRLCQTSADPEKSGLTKEQYDNLFVEYEEIEQFFSEMAKCLRETDKSVQDLQQLVDTATETIKEGEGAIVDAEKSIAITRANGMHVLQAETALEDARRFIIEARSAFARKEYRDLATQLKGVSDAVKRCNKVIGAVLKKKADLDKAIGEIDESLSSFPGRLDQAKKSLAETREKFNVLDVDLANPALEHASQIVKKARKDLENCKDLYGSQSWDEASKVADKVSSLLADAFATCEKVDQLPETLADLTAKLDGKVSQAEALVKKLSDFTREHQNELPTAITGKVEQLEGRLRTLTNDVRGSLTGVAESTYTVDMLINDVKHVLSVVEAAVGKVEQGRVRAREKNRSARSTSRGYDRDNNKSKGKSGKKGKSKDSDDSRSTTIIAVDNSMDSRDDLDRTSSRSSSYNSGGSSRRDSGHGSSGGGDSDWGSGGSNYGGGDSSFGGGGDSGSSGGGDSSW